MYGLQLIQSPNEEPLGLGEAKKWARVDHDAADDVFTGLIKAARRMAEQLLGRQLVTATWRMTLDCFPGGSGWQSLFESGTFLDRQTIRMPRAPLRSVTSVEYYDLAGDLQTLDTATYDVDAASDPGRLSLAQYKIWPLTRARPGAVRVTFSAGYGPASAVPEELKTAMKIAVAHWFERPADAGEMPPGALALMQANSNGEYP